MVKINMFFIVRSDFCKNKVNQSLENIKGAFNAVGKLAVGAAPRGLLFWYGDSGSPHGHPTGHGGPNEARGFLGMLGLGRAFFWGFGGGGGKFSRLSMALIF